MPGNTQRRKRTFGAIGWPESLLVLAAAAIVLPAVLWIRLEMQEEWRQTAGSVSATQIEETHYNATDYATKVSVRYTYSVDGIPYEDHWEGFWPAAGSPNALAPDRVHELKNRGYPLTVYYNPDNPYDTYLHPDTDTTRTLYGFWLAIAFGVFLLYALRFYPSLRR